MRRLPRRNPLSRAIGARPASAAAWRGVRMPSSGISASNAVAETGPPRCRAQQGGPVPQALATCNARGNGGLKPRDLALQEPQYTPQRGAHRSVKLLQSSVQDKSVRAGLGPAGDVFARPKHPSIFELATAIMLAKAIEASEFTQRETADRAGFRKANIISMLKTGETRVPLDRIPALAQTFGMDERDFLLTAIAEHHPGIHEVLVDMLGLPLSDAELGIVAMFRLARIRGEIEIEGSLKTALEGLLDLAALARR